MSNDLQTKLDDYLVLSKEGNSLINTDDLQQKLSQPSCYLEQKPKIVLKLQKSVTLKILIDIRKDLLSFLKPILELLDFFAYFHLHKCKIFIRYLNRQIDESEQSVEMLPTVSQSSSDAIEKLSKVHNYIASDLCYSCYVNMHF